MTQGQRVLPLDGLRGFLALGVFIHHAAIYPHYLRGDGWWTTGLPATLGPLGVSMFFMVTAYLFFGKLLAEQGRPNWARLYIGRLFRIAPVYLLAILLMFGIVLLPGIRVPPSQLAGEVAQWLTLGAGTRPDVNGWFDTRHLLAGVTWTLQSEWVFYASLPLLAVVARKASLAFPVAGLAVSLVLIAVLGPEALPACVSPFLAGMVCARLDGRITGWVASLSAVCLLAALCWSGAPVRGLSGILMLAGTFWFITHGATIFGLLTCRLARWLGSISYGVYMLHGLVLSRLTAISAVRELALQDGWWFWAFVVLAAIIVLAAADAAHRLIERPGIALGRRVADWVCERRKAVLTASAAT